jgi:predicted lysophospholipase L1 biosynthesis ABC-type transport system permease subunit
VVLVSAGYARETWNSVEGALGKRVRAEPNGPWQEVIGVVADVYDDGAHLPPTPAVYWPARENAWALGNIVPLSVAFVLRTDRSGTESLLQDMRQAVADVAPELPIAQVQTLVEVYDASMARTSLSLVLLGIAGAMALLLSIVGIYGVLAYVVMQRQREVGIRVALGATPRMVKRMFVYHGMIVAGVGIAVGAVAAAALTRLMSSLLFGVAPVDGVTFVAASGFLAVAALFASYIPARRAAALAPTETL